MLLNPTPRWSDGHIGLFPLTPALVSDDYVGWLGDPEVNRYLEVRFREQRRADVEAFVAAMEASERDLLLGISDLTLGRHVGNIKLGPIDRNHKLGEIGIMIGDRAAWGRGIGTAAIRRIADIAGHELGLRKLSAGCYAANLASRKAFERAGFAVEAVRPAHFLLDGAPEDTLLLGLLIDPQ
jgi:[ribosomal protein S5]-alanine N-acetyltransferase